ncbi:hypothetical protein YT10_002284 [Salmonella enterica subsp. enterica serovar Mbandaka]|nr:hypothetical protein [Salmonella enterica subsp. enterica serovar Mbandaka]
MPAKYWLKSERCCQWQHWLKSEHCYQWQHWLKARQYFFAIKEMKVLQICNGDDLVFSCSYTPLARTISSVSKLITH